MLLAGREAVRVSHRATSTFTAEKLKIYQTEDYKEETDAPLQMSKLMHPAIFHQSFTV